MLTTCDCSDTDGDSDRCGARAICTARKVHTCCECGCEIKHGMKYEDATGIDSEGSAYRFRTCIGCANLRKHYCPHGWWWGCLAEQIEPCIGFDYRKPSNELKDDDDEKEESSMSDEGQQLTAATTEMGECQRLAEPVLEHMRRILADEWPSKSRFGAGDREISIGLLTTINQVAEEGERRILELEMRLENLAEKLEKLDEKLNGEKPCRT